MEEDSKSIQDYFAILKRKKNAMLLIAIVVFLLTAVIVFFLPSIYRSTATILIEQQEIPQDLVRSTVTSYADQRIQVISQRVMTSKNLKGIIDKFDLYQEERKTETFASVLDEMREEISLEMVSADVVDPRSGRPTQATIAFTLSFVSENPKMAQQVANELVSLYLNENLRQRTQVAAEATSFLTLEANKLSEQISLLESKLAEFKEKNASSLPELQQLNLKFMDRTEQQIIEVGRQIGSLTERKLYLESELAQLNPYSNIYSATGERIYGTDDRLKALEAEYIALTASYSGDHPDLIKMQKEIAALEKEQGGISDPSEYRAQLKDKRAELALLRDRYSQDHPDVKKIKLEIASLEKALDKPLQPINKKTQSKPDNPAYIQLQTQLTTTQAELRSLRLSRNKLDAKLTSYEERLTQAPQVEREYQILTRDYDNARLKYREVKAKQMEADMSQAMEKDRKGERFSLIEPPLFPEEPFKPNRKALVFLGFVLSIGMAVAYAVLKESLDQSIYGVRDIAAITGAPPLVVIPYLVTDEELLSKHQRNKMIPYLAVAMLVLAVIVFHFAFMPLDVFWYALLRKTGTG